MSQGKEIEACLFDIDGTLLDTATFIQLAFQATFQEFYQKEITWEEMAGVMGKPLEECYKILAQADDETIVKLAVYHRDFQLKNPHLSTLFPNTVQTLQDLKDQGMKLAAVTSRVGKTVLDGLERADILNYFDAVVTGDMVTQHKPNKEPVLKALEMLGVAPENAVMIGDTEVDVLAGKHAGTMTVGVSYGFQGEKIKEFEPDAVLDDIGLLATVLLTLK